MTVSSTNTKNSYSGDASTTVFAYTFKVFDDDDISVILRTDATGGETVQTKGTHYSVSGVGNAGRGNITFVTPPASGITVVLIRATVQTQTTDYTPNDPFPAASHEEALDRLTLIVQDQQEELDRSIKVSRTNTISSSEFTIGATDRANKVFAFDENGDFSVTQEIGTYKGTDATVTASAYSARDIVKSTTAAQLDNVYIATQNSPAGTSLTNTTYWQLLIDAVAAATSAANAAASAVTAEGHADDSETAQAAAEAAQALAETAQTNAETAETNAQTAQTAAEAAQAAAETAETNAETAETNAASSATASASSASASAASASAASTSESNASTSETNAAASASSASTSASTATTQAGIATTKAGEAGTSATNSANSAANSATSETNAASSATAAAASQVSAANSAASAAAAFDNFDDTYLGSFASDPTVDNDGDALVQGALYFNTTANEMRVYDGGNWIAASSAGGVSLILYEYTATAGQTTFSGADDNAATLSYTANNIQVVMNGVILDPSDYTATNGTSVVLASGAALNDVVNIYAFQSFTVADTVSASAGGTFNADVKVLGDVGIGTSSPSADLDVASSNATIHLTDTDDTTYAEIRNNGGTLTIGSDVGQAAGGSSINFKVDGSEAMRILSSGGITFNGDTSSANALNDYEEGTWTCTPSDSSGNNSSTTASGAYTKIGNVVSLRINAISNIDTTGLTGTDNLRFNGLPFTVSGNSSGSSSCNRVTFASGRTMNLPRARNGQTYFEFLQDGNDANTAIASVSDLVSGVSDVTSVSIVYMTTA